MSAAWERWQQEVDAFPSNVKEFLTPDPQDRYATTWEFFGSAYSKGFDLLAEAAAGPEGHYHLRVPLFYLARHSIELSIKAAILEYAAKLEEEPRIAGHSLARLWAEFLRLMEVAGFSADDDWTAHCAKLVAVVHDIDPDGERFRYPRRLKGEEFVPARIDVDELAVAIMHIGYLCESCCEMFDALGRQKQRG